jgi:hypothetical protein
LIHNKKLDLANLWVPTYQIAQSRVPIALIIVGKQGIIRKLPPKQRYFYDKDLGLFEIKPEAAILINKTEFYIFDSRNANPINPGKWQILSEWANRQGLYKIRRSDVEHASRLRTKDLAQLKEEVSNAQREVRAFVLKIKEQINAENQKTKERQEAEAGLEDNPDEYHIIQEDEANKIIIDNLYKNGYIDAKQQGILKHRLVKKEIQSQEQLLEELDSFNTVHVTEAISFELERVLDDYHTYQPQSIIEIITRLAKVYKGLKNLRTKPVINWFPWTYILGGCLGAGIIIMMIMNYLPTSGEGLSIPGLSQP